MNSIDEIYEKLGYAFKNILTDDIVKTGWTQIKVRYDITWDGESESYIYWDPDGNIHSFRELFDGIFGEKFKLYKKRQEEYGITVSLAGNLYPMYKKTGKEISVVYYELYKNGEYKVEVLEKNDYPMDSDSDRNSLWEYKERGFDNLDKFSKERVLKYFTMEQIQQGIRTLPTTESNKLSQQEKTQCYSSFKKQKVPLRYFQLSFQCRSLRYVLSLQMPAESNWLREWHSHQRILH